MNQVSLVECMNFSWQGEGADAGKKMLLLRFKRCNRQCSYCDTQVKMRVFQEASYPIRDLQEMIEENNLAVMITGGEPTFNLNLGATVNIINLTKSYLYNVETNGCNLLGLIEKVNKNKRVKYFLSPKLFEQEDTEFYNDLVVKIKDNASVHIKLVYEETDRIINFLEFLKSIEFDTNRVWLMPEGVNRESLIKNSPIVFNAAEKYKTQFSSRNHIMYDFV